jgi:glycosyltransferase involved in cell wall biosynthesis
MAGRDGRPRLLFVTYTFPPAAYAGSVRVWNVAKYLARSGWAVTVLTLNPSLWRHVESLKATEIDLKREGIRRLAADHRWRWLAADTLNCSNQHWAWVLGGICRRVARGLGIDKTVGWVKAAERACSGLRTGDVDVILASGPPFSTFSLVQRLSERLGCPYVLDYRDLWSRNHFHPAPGAAEKEASVVAGSAAVITVSPSWSSVMERQFGVGPKLHIISNGYDAEAFASVEPHHFGHFAIVYAGALTPPKQTISPIMAALERLDQRVPGQQREWKFHYFGRDTRHVLEEADRFRVAARVIVHGRVPRQHALSAVKGADVAVVITSVVERATPEDNGVVTSKIFEAVGLRTPTLLIAPAGSDANAVAEIAGLARSFTAAGVDGIASFLGDAMNGHLLEPKDPAAYAWENLVSGLDRVLRKAIER